MKRIFISSVQKEFADVRRILKRYVSKNPAYRRLFDTFVFEEDVVAADRRTDEVYLAELSKCDIYIGLIGKDHIRKGQTLLSPRICSRPVVGKDCRNRKWRYVAARSS